MRETGAFVATLLRSSPMCLDCVTQQGAVSRETLDAALAAISRVLVLHRDNDTCPMCGRVGPILGLDRRRT